METEKEVFPADAAPRRRLGRVHCVLSLLTLMALAFRLWGITWSLPNETRAFTYHPDEGVNLVNGVLEDGKALRPHLDLKFYNYGSLYFYTWQAAAAANNAYGIVRRSDDGHTAPQPNAAGAVLLIGRLLSALFGTLTLLPLFVIGRRFGGDGPGLMSCALFAFAPAAVEHAHFATVDSLATFLVAVAIAAGLRLLVRTGTPEPPGRILARTALLAGVLAGLAGAARYNAILVFAAPLATSILGRERSTTRKVLLATLVLVGCAVGFLAGCPGVFLNPEKFWADVGFEVQKSRLGMGLLFAETGSGWLYHATVSLPYALTWPALAAGLAGAAAAFRIDRTAALSVGGFLLLFFAVIGAAEVKFLRYVLPMMPVLCAFTGGLLAPLRGRPALAIPFAAVVIALPAFASARLCSRFSGEDPRDVALASLRGRLAPGGSIAFAATPWYGSPPLLPEFTAPVSGAVRRRLLLQTDSAYLLRLPAENAEWDPSVLRDPAPDCVALSSFEAHDALRIGWKPAKEFLAELRKNYDEVSFGSNPRWLSAESTRRLVPNDWMYLDPQVSLFFRRNEQGP